MASLLLDEKEDPELRIQAYLALMNRADEETISMISKLLEYEQVNQVGRFIFTHVTNLAETSDPLKQDLKNILENSKFNEKFNNLPPFQYSRNIEKSFYAGMLNLGGQVESNLIYSKESFLPRSGNLNFTIDWFGRAVNLFEVGFRAQNMQNYLSEILGFIGQENVTKEIKEKIPKKFPFKIPGRLNDVEWTRVGDHFNEHRRFKRGIKFPRKINFDKIKKIDKEVSPTGHFI